MVTEQLVGAVEEVDPHLHIVAYAPPGPGTVRVMPDCDVIVIGAGACGLTVARRIVDEGGSVVVIDKGSRPGGRLASRKVGGHVVDTAASAVTIADPGIRDVLERWAGARFGAGGAHEGQPGGPMIWTFDVPASDVAARWASDLDRRTGFVTHLAVVDGGVAVTMNGAGDIIVAGRVVLTAPAPQAVGILTDSSLPLPDGLAAATYDHELLVVAHVNPPADRPTAVTSPAFSGLTWGTPNDPTAPVLIARVAHDVAEATVCEDANLTHGRLLVELARVVPGLKVHTSDLKRWRYARPVRTVPGPGFAVVGEPEVIAVAGDTFGDDDGTDGVERAVRSGLAVADWLAASTVPG